MSWTRTCDGSAVGCERHGAGGRHELVELLHHVRRPAGHRQRLHERRGGAATDCRGADTATEFARQHPKTVTAIRALNPDVLGVDEIENDGYGAEARCRIWSPGSMRPRVCPTPTRLSTPMPAPGSSMRSARMRSIYKPAVVTPVGLTGALNSEAFVNGGDGAPRNRASLAQAFPVNGTGAVFIVNINHFESKGSECDAPDLGDGQGNCNDVRVNAATALLQWLGSDPTGTGDPDVLMIGDDDAYA
jgi:predicted extracellular nuclease